MFIKAALAFLAIGALSANALTVPVARSPAPEPDCESPRSFSITSYHDLTLDPFTAQEPEAWMLKRDLSDDLFSRELQALDELFSREPEGWAQRAKRGPTDIPTLLAKRTKKPTPVDTTYLAKGRGSPLSAPLAHSH